MSGPRRPSREERSSAGFGQFTRFRRLLAGLAAHVRPTFMLPAVATSAYGAALAPALDPAVAVLHAAAVGAALFVAHLRDGYVDGHLRGEEDPPLPAGAYRWSVRAGTAVVLVLAGALAAVRLTPAVLGVAAGDSTAAAGFATGSVLVLLALALLHAPYLDRYTVPVTVDYPVGIAVALCGAFAAQRGIVTPAVAAVAGLLAVVLAGVKVSVDRLDAAFDRTVGKRTVPVAFGPADADRVAAGLFGLAALGTAGAVATGVLPAVALLAALAPLCCLVATLALPPERAVRIGMVLASLFVAVLFVPACGGDCVVRTVADVALPWP